jgi:hypothetical protein
VLQIRRGLELFYLVVHARWLRHEGNRNEQASHPLWARAATQLRLESESQSDPGT